MPAAIRAAFVAAHRSHGVRSFTLWAAGRMLRSVSLSTADRLIGYNLVSERGYDGRAVEKASAIRGSSGSACLSRRGSAVRVGARAAHQRRSAVCGRGERHDRAGDGDDHQGRLACRPTASWKSSWLGSNRPRHSIPRRPRRSRLAGCCARSTLKRCRRTPGARPSSTTRASCRLPRGHRTICKCRWRT